MRRFAALLLVAMLGTASCVRRAPPPAPVLRAAPHYVLGNPYQAGGHWFYPAESYALDATGLAETAVPQKTLTADGELPDPLAATAAMQTIQLPAIVEVTNLENGRQSLVRVNDRGPRAPGRIIALSPRAALLLAIPPGAATRVRVRVEETLSRQLVEQVGGGPKLAIATAPAAAVTTETLPPPGSVAPAGQAYARSGAVAERAMPLVPDRLPERIRLVSSNPGQLWLRCGVFGRFEYANRLAAILAGLGGDVLRLQDGRHTSYAVRAGPFGTVPEADAALEEALRGGVIDARITVE